MIKSNGVYVLNDVCDRDAQNRYYVEIATWQNDQQSPARYFG